MYFLLYLKYSKHFVQLASFTQVHVLCLSDLSLMYTHIQTLMDISESYLGLVSYPRILSTQTEAARDRMINLFLADDLLFLLSYRTPQHHNVSIGQLAEPLFIYLLLCIISYLKFVFVTEFCSSRH